MQAQTLINLRPKTLNKLPASFLKELEGNFQHQLKFTTDFQDSYKLKLGITTANRRPPLQKEALRRGYR